MAPTHDKERVYFILIEEVDDFGFADYYDKDGKYRVIENREDAKTGKKKKRFFHWTTQRRHIGIPVWDKDAIKHIRESPFTEGSPNCFGDARIKELNEEKDAKVILDDTTKMLKAMNEAMALSGDKLRQVAYMYGMTKNPSSEITKSLIVKNAQLNPDHFLGILDSTNLEVQALVKACIAEKVLVEQGGQIYWGKDWMGDFDKVVGLVASDKEMKDTLKKKLEAQGKKS